MAGPVVEVLMQIPLFADLDAAEIQLLADAMRGRTFAAGETVTAEGTIADGFFVVEDGEAEVSVQGEHRARITGGDSFGEIALLMGSERTATITAISDLRCYVLGPAEFRAIVEGNPTIAWKVMQTMAERLS